MKNIRLWVVLLLAGLVSGCANIEPLEKKTQQQLLTERQLEIEKQVHHISNHRISGWSYLDDHGIILSGGVKRKYLVTFAHAYSGLRWTDTLVTTSTMNQLTGFDKVLVRRFGGGMVDRCMIDKIYLLKNVDKQPEKIESENTEQPTAEKQKVEQ